MTRPLRVFLCHASQDKPAVRKLYRYLKQHGIQPWLDQDDLLPGENWEVEIPRAIDDSDVILVCLSKNSINKEGYVQKEISFALDKALEKPEGTIFIIPAKLEDCEVPKRLNRYQWVDLFRSESNKRLLQGLNKRALSLGSEVSPVIVDDTRQRKPATKPVVDSDALDRDTVEKASREKMEREEAAQAKLKQEAAEQAEIVRLAQATKEKAERDAAEKAALEKAEQEKQERETAERLVREQKEREAAEKAALEKENHEKVERETAERLAQEKAAFEKEKKEKQEREQVQRPVGRVSNPKNTLNENVSRAVSPTYKDAPKTSRQNSLPAYFRIGGMILIALLFIWFGGNYVIKNFSGDETNPTPAPSATLLPVVTPTATKIPTSTPVPPIFTPVPDIGSTQVSKKDGMTLVFVPAGGFTMGSDAGESDEQPVRTVNLDAFWIDQTEVTNAMYVKCIEDGGCTTPPSSSNSYTHEDYYGNSEFDEYPVIYVDWSQANAYCSWAGRRLPTEAEWEKAARGLDGNIYPWGNTFDGTLVNFCDVNCPFSYADKLSNDGYEDVAPVGSYLDGASIYGALDMSGNVWEWVSSLYQGYPYSATDGREDLSASGSRVLRGGSWLSDGSYVRSAYRFRYDPTYSNYFLGFRCSLSHP